MDGDGHRWQPRAETILLLNYKTNNFSVDRKEIKLIKNYC